MAYNIEKANRDDGSWVDGYCPYRASPCKNPLCVDEAMRAGQIYSGENIISRLNSEQALKYAFRRAKQCDKDGLECPLGSLEQRLNLIALLKDQFRNSELTT